MKHMRFDLIFSYWIFAWYICYMLKWTRYNPKLALLIGILENGVMAILMLYYNTRILPYFLMVNMVIKVVPYYSIQRKIQWSDVYPTLGLFMVYIGWILFHGQYTTVLRGMDQYVKGDVSVFPASHWIMNKFQNMHRMYFK